MIYLALAGALLLACASCGGTVIESVTADKLKATTNTLTMSYFLPVGQTSLTVAADGRGIATTFSGTNIIPDYNSEPLYLRYDHQGLSTEDLSFGISEEGLLASASSTTQGQLSDLIKGVNDVLTQYSAFKDAQAAQASKNHGTTYIEQFTQPPVSYEAACKGLALPISTVIRAGSPDPFKKTINNDNMPACTLTATVTVKLVTPLATPSSTAPFKSSVRDFCQGVVCFRAQSLFSVAVQSSLALDDKSGYTLPKVSPPSGSAAFKTLAPDSNYLGYVRFPRGTFASKTVAVEFTKGVLTKYSAKNSSELVGFLAIPAAALTTATLIEKLN